MTLHCWSVEVTRVEVLPHSDEVVLILQEADEEEYEDDEEAEDDEDDAVSVLIQNPEL